MQYHQIRWLLSISLKDEEYAGIAQLVEHDLAKVGVASSSLVSRSKFLSPVQIIHNAKQRRWWFLRS